MDTCGGEKDGVGKATLLPGDAPDELATSGSTRSTATIAAIGMTSLERREGAKPDRGSARPDIVSYPLGGGGDSVGTEPAAPMGTESGADVPGGRRRVTT